MSLPPSLPELFSRLPKFERGEVWLVGAGPGDPAHLTVLALHALCNADYVVYDALVDRRVLDLVNEQATLQFAGKRGGKPSAKQDDINRSIVAHAKAGRKVLRLKGGDPFVFGRGGEEIAALAHLGVPYRIVPGLTSGLAATALAGIPATQRATNHAVILATGHLAIDAEAERQWEALGRVGQPIIFYMAMSNLDKIAAALQRGGMSEETSVAIISSASTPDERVYKTCLRNAASLARAENIEPPAIVVVGEITSLQRRSRPVEIEVAS